MEAAGDLLRSHDEMLAEVRQRLIQAQQLAKHYYDGHHREAEFAVGDWVWLRLLHRSTQSLDPRAKRKLGPCYAGPFSVLERIGKVAYRLQLLAGARIHDVFHVGLLPWGATGGHARASSGLRRAPPSRTSEEEEATWEQRDEFRQHYPDFQLEDELFAQAGRDVMTGL
ncbi:uncharacterized protein [Aegilops tauschii subsp. strangulata]|uniref:uncharacterized protein n=1 Tax=Aegilops tauschii subsp. strangulata TaxID=200361 RepID=UPI003CC8BD69